VRPELVGAVGRALEAASIPFRSGRVPGQRPAVIFSVPRDRLAAARAAVADTLGETRPDLPASAEKFPLRPLLVAGSLILLHFVLLLWIAALGSGGRRLFHAGALLRGAMIDEPWRLLTYSFLHTDLLHAFWNGASTLVFAVPLMIELRYARAGLIYFVSGIGGGVAALAFARPGISIVGSSGAVAGLFGAWVVLTLSRVRLAPLTGRAFIRAAGIAMLYLPSLLSPVTALGRPVSVSSHVGGLATGMAIGALISYGLLRRAMRVIE